jgi:hypothetical protein
MHQGVLQTCRNDKTDKGSFFMEHAHPVNSFLINSIRTAICSGALLSQAHAALIINEIDYDQPGTDSGEFIELFNSGNGDILLDGFTLDLINGTTGSSYRPTINLSGLNIGADAYLVLCDSASSVANCNYAFTPSTGWFQNGSSSVGDAVALYDATGQLIDSVVYEGIGTTLGAFAEGGTSAGADSNSVIMSLSRLPNGMDTDNNSNDFATGCLTPGSANSAGTGDCSIIPSVPLPAAFWLFGSGLVALLGIGTKRDFSL